MHPPTAVYVWGPGYSLENKVKQKDGSIIEKKVFVPTATVTVAASFLLKHYGSPEAVLAHKQDIHPGHAAIGIEDKYLSIGMMDELSTLKATSRHKVVLSSDLIQDTLAFARVPHCIDFHTLDTKKNVKIYRSIFK